jgi:hypothetical protein
MEGVMRALAKNKIPWTQDLFFAVKLARPMLSKYYAEVTPATGMLLISACILDPYDLSSDDEEYITPSNVAKMTPGRSDRSARLLTATRLYLNSLPKAPKHCGQINPNLNDYHSDPKEISSTVWILDITDWWRQQDETHSKYADLSNVARDIFSIIPHGVGLEARFSLGRVVIGWRQSKPRGETFRKKFVVKQFARANSRMLVGTNPELNNHTHRK